MDAWLVWMQRCPAPVHQWLLRLAYLLMVTYRYVFRPSTRGVCIAVWARQRLLLIHHSYKKNYGVPAGLIRHGESLRVAAVRELKEEVGLVVDGALLRDAGRMLSRAHGNDDHLQFFELILDFEPPLRPDGREVTQAQFCSLEDVLCTELIGWLRDWLDTRVRAGLAPPSVESAKPSGGHTQAR